MHSKVIPIRAFLAQDPPRPVVSEETILLLSQLLKQAQVGSLTGLAIAAVHQKHEYAVYATGTARLHPTFSRGMVKALDDELATLIYSNK